jgi:hypothetical protein
MWMRGSPDRGCVRQVVTWRDGYQPMRRPVWEGATDGSRSNCSAGPPWLFGAMGGGIVAVRKQLHEHFCSVATLTRPANADKPLSSGLLAKAPDTPTMIDSMLGAEMAKSAQPRTIAGFLAIKRCWVKRRPI